MERQEETKKVKEVAGDNTIKWASIDLMIHYLINSRTNCEQMCQRVFETPVTLSEKYDGTNVGKDEYGQLYGRNKMILPDTTSYQKTELKCMKEIDVAKLKMAFVMQVGVKAYMLKKFVAYGELMCNPGLYDYADNGVSGTYQLFGLMIETDPELQDEIYEKVKNAGYSVLKKTENPYLQVVFNRTYQNLVKSLNYPTVPLAGEYQSLFEAVKANKAWMVEGKGEGMMVVTQGGVKKWKIGAERNATNIDLINGHLNLIDNDKSIYGTQHENMKEFLNILKEIQLSTKFNYDQEGPPDGEYEIAIKSAMTKYDHHDTFEYEDYLEMISKECLEDIKIQAGKMGYDKHKKHIDAIFQQWGIKPKKIKQPKTSVQKLTDNRNAEQKKADREAAKKANEDNNDASMGGLFGDDEDDY